MQCWPQSATAWARIGPTGPASPAQLYEARDLKPTIGLDALIGGALAAHFALDPALAVPRLFPGSTGTPLSGLIRG